MSILYKLVPINDNISGKPVRGFIPTVVRKKTISTKELIEQAESISSFRKSDIASVLGVITEELKVLLLKGNNVNIEGIGTFSIVAESQKIEKAKDNKPELIRVKRIAYRPSRELTKELKESAKFKFLKKNKIK